MDVASRYAEAREIYQYILDNFPGNEYEVWALGGLATASLKLGDTEAGNAAADRLVAEFAEDSNMPFLANDVGTAYVRCQDYGRAQQFFTRVLSGEPPADQKIWATAGMAKAKAGSGQYAEAQSLVQQLLGEFKGDEQLAEQLNDIALSFKQAGREDDAQAVYGLLVENYPSSTTVRRLQFATLSSQIESLIKAEKTQEAQAAVSTMITAFANSPDIARTLYSIACKYEDIRCQEEAGSLYSKIISDYSHSEEAAKSELGKKWLEAASLVRSGSDELVQQKVSDLLADANYTAEPELALRIYQIGEEYYWQTLAANKAGDEAEGEVYHSKAAVIWERCINEAPQSPHKAYAYYSTAALKRKRGECAEAISRFEKVLTDWPDFELAANAQFAVGRCYEKMWRGGEMTKQGADAKTKEAFEKLLNKWPDCQAAPIAAKWLARHGTN